MATNVQSPYTNVQSPYTSEQVTTWLRGLLSVAWVDGNFDAEEKALIANLTQEELAPPSLELQDLKPITPEELAVGLGRNRDIAENFLRTAVMVAVADGVYSTPEDRLLHQFCHEFGHGEEILGVLRTTLYDDEAEAAPEGLLQPTGTAEAARDVLKPARDWLDGLEVHDPRLARFLCKMIPSQCPFERDVELFGKKIVHIPPLCKLNPLYEQLVSLRFRSLSYLADECNEDISNYY